VKYEKVGGPESSSSKKKKKFPLSQAVEVRRGMETNHRSATTTRRGDARVQCSVFVMSSVGLAAG